jgi:hypothetical protein
VHLNRPAMDEVVKMLGSLAGAQAADVLQRAPRGHGDVVVLRHERQHNLAKVATQGSCGI